MERDVAEAAADIAAQAIEGIAAGFSRADPEKDVNFATIARMLYEIAARMRNELPDELERRG